MTKLNKFEFSSALDLIKLTNKFNVSISEVVLSYSEIAEDMSREDFLKEMNRRYQIMKESVRRGIEIEKRTASGLSGGDAKKLDQFDRSKSLLGETLAKAVKYSFAIQEHNARFGRIVAFPTAGSAGTVPATLIAAQESMDLPDEKIAKAMFTAAGIGMIAGERAMLAGAMGGCQAEVGAASAMAAGALTEIRGGTPREVFTAASIALKGLLGLVCDPIGGLVESPCVKRNATAVANAYMASEVALAGVESNVSFDQVLVAMKNIADVMADDFKETARGGLAITDVGMKVGAKMGLSNSGSSNLKMKCLLCG